MAKRAELTDEVQTAVLQAISAAVTRDVAAGYAGIDVQTFQRWMELGKATEPCITAEHYATEKQHRACPEALGGAAHPDGECPHLSRFRDFREAVLRGEQALHTKLAGEIVKAAPRDWHAAMAILKAKWPKVWNVPQITQLDISGELAIAPARERLGARILAMHLRAIGAGQEPPEGDDGEALDREKETA